MNAAELVPRHSDFDSLVESFGYARGLFVPSDQLKRIPVILKRSLRGRNNWRIRLGLVVG